MKFITTVILKGLAVILPIGLTLYIVYWLGAGAERWLGSGLEAILDLVGLPYVTGMGVATGIVLLFVVGVLTYSVVFRRLVEYLGRLLEKIPLVKTLYGGLRDLMDFVRQSRSEKQGLSQVVRVRLTDQWQLLGFITRERFDDLPEGLACGDDCVAVYLPMSYQIGGFTIFISRDRVEPIDMTVEDGMRLALTAGMSARKKPDELRAGPTRDEPGRRE
jgi:uncharacterized membrane protein